MPFEIDSLFTKFIQQKSQILPFEIVTSDREARLLNQIEKKIPFLSEAERKKGFELALYIGLTSENKINRENAVYLLVQAVKDPSHLIRLSFSRRMANFKREDFSERSIKELRAILNNVEDIHKHIIQLAGLLELKKEAEILKERFILPRHQQKTGRPYFCSMEWATHLVLARLGQKEDIQYVINRLLQEHPDNIAIFYLEDLAYVRQPETIAVVIEYLLGDGRLPEMDNGAKESYANRAMSQLAKSIKGFPFEYDEGKMYRGTDIQEGKAWINENRSSLQFNMNSF